MQTYDVWFLRYCMQQTYFFVILDHFLPFYPLTTQKSKFWNTEKNTWRYYHLHICTINDKHMMYGSWDITCNRHFFVILDHFLPFYPPINPKNQTFENMKNIPGDIIILHMCPINDYHMIYGSWDMEHDKQNFLLF